ncbi:MAG: transcription antitermination protein NusB [Muribaculaceae bacterium]|nr:transcription antitermination protein NusB [Muribaculaceae bacterium]
MINRVLIRIKAIQILYSYLLVEKKFSFESMPSLPTKEKRFAYALYLDMLVLMYRVARSIQRRGGDEPLADTRFIKRLANDEQLKPLLAKYRTMHFPFEGAVDRIAEALKNSAYYKNWLKKSESGELGAEEGLWKDIFNIFVIPDKGVNEAISQRENFTLKGVERMKELMETTFTGFLASQDDGTDAAKAFAKSIDMARELYFLLLLLPVELTDLRERQLEENRNKYLTTEEDLNPNLKFVENSLVEEIRRNETISSFVEKNKLSWMQTDPFMMESLLKAIMESEIYAEYMEDPVSSPTKDMEFWKNVFKKVVLENQDFLEYLEDKSVFWNDDLEIMSTFALKTMRRLSEGDRNAVLDKFKDEEDARFGYDLIRYVLKNKDEYRGYIDEALVEHRWDRDRLAFMDVLVIETALAEILNFPKIPLSVSVNEYIEIAKSYSSAKSGGFVNGLLGSVLKNLKESGKLLK